MEFDAWHLWLIAALIFFIAEIFMPTFLMVSIGIGCILSFTGAIFSESIIFHLSLFSIGTTAGFFGIRPVLIKYAYTTDQEVKTNVFGLVGKIGKVIETINSSLNTGCVAVDGDTWKAVTLDDSVVEVGDKVEIVEVNSIILTVQTVPSKTNSQKQDTMRQASATDSNSSNHLLVKVGNRSQLISFASIYCLNSNHKNTFLISNEGREYVLDESLDSLMFKLSGSSFFRANRQYIISLDCIKEIKPAGNGKLKIILQDKLASSLPANITVSRLKSAAFRRWLKQQC